MAFIPRLVILFVFFFARPSPASACDRCVRRSKAAYRTSSPALDNGTWFLRVRLLGAVFQRRAPRRRGPRALQGRRRLRRVLPGPVHGRGPLPRRGRDGGRDGPGAHQYHTDLVLGGAAYAAMARRPRERAAVDVEYRRAPCEYARGRNLSVRAEARAAGDLAVRFLYQGGQTDIVAVDVATAGSSGSWKAMARERGGPAWSTSQAPAGPLQLRMVVTGGYDGKWVWADGEVIPRRWAAGRVYDTGVQIDDVALKGCSHCDAQEWK
ncbi:hypothetical protein ACQ4PT_028273 [Festuca glaucescens]